jgi:glutamate--cysteine ligase
LSKLTEVFISGERDERECVIGAEHELLCLDRSNRVPGYEGRSGIATVLKELAVALDWQHTVEADQVIGLKGPTASVTLEPGGQLELAGSPSHDLHTVAEEVRTFHTVLSQIAKPLGLSFFGMGLRPITAVSDVPTMPKSRYEIMKSLMPTLGSRSLEMMFSTATIQTNLDFRNEADMARKYRVSACLSPVVAALFANSPYQNGRRTGRMTERYAIWDDTDTQRSGRFDWMVEQRQSYQTYADWAAQQRMLFLYRNELYQPASDHSFAQHDQTTAARPHDWEQHLAGIFPEIRLKSFLELRSADAGCGQMVVALNALWTGLLYDQEALDLADELTQDWTAASWQQLATTAATHGLSGVSDYGSLKELAAAVLSLAEDGLKRRGHVNGQGHDERLYLAPLHMLVHLGVSQAELMLQRFGEDVESALQFAAKDLWEFPW